MNRNQLDRRSGGPFLYNEILLGVVSQDFSSHLVGMAAAIDGTTKVCDLAAAGADDQADAVFRTPRPVVWTGNPATGFLRLVGCFRVHGRCSFTRDRFDATSESQCHRVRKITVSFLQFFPTPGRFLSPKGT